MHGVWDIAQMIQNKILAPGKTLLILFFYYLIIYSL